MLICTSLGQGYLIYLRQSSKANKKNITLETAGIWKKQGVTIKPLLSFNLQHSTSFPSSHDTC